MDPKQVNIRQLVEEMMSTGRTAEDVCVGSPELLDGVRTLWEQVRCVVDEIDSLFPDPDVLDAQAAATRENGGEKGDAPLPRIPGYEVQSIVGLGGMGVVYKARHLSLNRTVAIKVPLGGAFATTSERQRHQREAQAIAALHHPNIVTVHDVGEFEGRPYLTMEFIEGRHLGDRLAGAPLPTRDSAALLATLADAIHYSHLAGVTHRDLKPANVLVTPDGTPKIADFGLARHFEHDATLTAAGVHFGTPSYMAPEQARGQKAAKGAGVDIYALGAILYEMLTGRPPFRAESSHETVRQVLEDEPAPPRRLNPATPRDLETICLRCLRKVPGERYASAAALAEDLRRFLHGEPIRARPMAFPERTIKWIRRKPATATAIFSLLLLLSIVAAGAVWRSTERAARAVAAEQDLREAARLHESAAWKEADAAIDRAELRLNGGGPKRLQRWLSEAKHNSDMAARLEKIRLDRVSSINGYYRDDKVHAAYVELFREEGVIRSDEEKADAAASRILASSIHGALLDAIDLWIVVTRDIENRRLRNLLQEIAQRVDPSPERKQLFDLVADADQEAVDRVVGTFRIAEHPPMMFTAFAERIESNRLDVVPLLTAVQRAHPADFWANMALADSLATSKPTEAIRYYQAAIVLRPDASVVYNNLANALGRADRPEDAADAYRTALKLDPAGGIIRVNYAWALCDLHRYEESVAQARTVLAMERPDPEAWLVLAEGLFCLEQTEEAAASLRKGFENPSITDEDMQNVHQSLVRAGRLPDARLVWAEHLKRRPSRHEDWDGYAELCLFLGDEAAYRDACTRLLERFGDDPDPGVSERTGRACLLLPTSGKQLAEATAAVDRALASEQSLPEPTWLMAYYRVAGALAAYRAGDCQLALTLLDASTDNTLGPMPLLIRAMAQHQLGDAADARETLTQALARDEWRSPPLSREKWMYHILRREAEALIRPGPTPAP